MASSFHSSLPMSLGQKRSAAAKERNVLKRAAGRPRKYITEELQIELQANPNKWKLVVSGIRDSSVLKAQAKKAGLTAKFVSTKMEKIGEGADARYKYTGDLYVSFQTAPMSLYS